MTREFTKLNPNKKIPVLVDEGLIITESGAILIYLAEKTGKLLPQGTKQRIKTIEMIMFQMASFGPMFGQLLVFAGAWKNEYPAVTTPTKAFLSRRSFAAQATVENSSIKSTPNPR
jgi:GSH-dependent disulfide-bond oxidoreductase